MLQLMMGGCDEKVIEKDYNQLKDRCSILLLVAR